VYKDGFHAANEAGLWVTPMP